MEHKISWLNMPGYKPETWNPIVGCSKVSAGCENCYAEVMGRRLKGIALAKVGPMSIWKYAKVITDGKWNGTTYMSEVEIMKPNDWKTPRMIFVCSMGDLFHESVPFKSIYKVIDQAVYHPEHLFIILTKRPERMAEYFKEYPIGIGFTNAPLNNIWLGVTAEKQEQANIRIRILLKIPAAKRFVSVEPMLGAVDLTRIKQFNGEGEHIASYQVLEPIKNCGDSNRPALDWVICGGESGPKARPMHPNWVRSLRDQCKGENVPFFFKGWGTYRPLTTTKLIENLPCGDYNVSSKLGFVKWHRTMIGATIDNCEHKEWPKED